MGKKRRKSRPTKRRAILHAKLTNSEQRAVLADVCKVLLNRQRHVAQPRPSAKPKTDTALPAQVESLSPRLSQTLELLLAGAGEKQIAAKLNLSQHTVHVYVKALHKGFGVSSRGELLSKFVVSPRARLMRSPLDS